MRLKHILIKDWACFRGEHILNLDPKVYAIVARHAQDPERSNWSGKSSLLEAIVFALYGVHRHRYEDDCISHGEPSMKVALQFSNGVEIERSRSRGKATSFFVWPDPGSTPSRNAEAEEEIGRFVGLTEKDFRATCYFEQRQMARFVLSDPSERMRTISAWFRLAPLEKCEAHVRELGAALEDKSKQIDGHLAAIEQREQAIAKELGFEQPPKPGALQERLEVEIRVQNDELMVGSSVVKKLETELEANAKIIANQASIAEYDQLVATGKAVRERMDKVKLPVLQQTWEAAVEKDREEGSKKDALAREKATKTTLARGKFDGVCPVAGIDCPAKDPINSERERNAKLLAEADKKYSEQYETWHRAREAERAAHSQLSEGKALESRLNNLRENARRLAPLAQAAKEGPDPVNPIEIRAKLDQARSEMLDARARLQRYTGWVEELDQAAKNKAALVAKKAEYATELGTYREAVVVFGKRGAQRRVAEGALSQIQDDANEVLRSCGVNLQVEARWSREGKDIATACDACGNPFPKSAKVKHCERCGAPRGNKLENKLDVVLSDRSGAAEDLAGASLQLAASRWLREERGTTWSTALLDEPFGALDAAHRKGFAAHLTSMLAGRYGFEQAFVVAHHASVLDALPGRIEIVSDGKWSVPRVAA
jgi:DNA repair exonuclease SbcCD ATPase subunit